MNEVKTKTVRVFVGGGRSSFTPHPAYRRAAWQLITQKHCDCCVDIEEGTGRAVDSCRFHRDEGYYGKRVVSRLVRLWMRRDKVSAGSYRYACKFAKEDWGNVPLPSTQLVTELRRKGWKFRNQVAALRELARRHPEEYQGLMAATSMEEAIRE